ncbi:hypothetical protein NPIL_503901 [Nephila pilipes]|uniref:Uncharacterized protein n=1 Tax=Nephila pilipes TaxID=299642 RepID=A0A8X6QZ16_NEPPI|nr:hypothetical protein NPIL_503901 [Nephila pilipes]
MTTFISKVLAPQISTCSIRNSGNSHEATHFRQKKGSALKKLEAEDHLIESHHDKNPKLLILQNATLRPLSSNEKDLTIPFVPPGAIPLLKCIFSQCSIQVLPSIAKWRRTQKEEIEQNPRLMP